MDGLGELSNRLVIFVAYTYLPSMEELLFSIVFFIVFEEAYSLCASQYVMDTFVWNIVLVDPENSSVSSFLFKGRNASSHRHQFCFAPITFNVVSR